MTKSILDCNLAFGELGPNRDWSGRMDGLRQCIWYVVCTTNYDDLGINHRLRPPILTNVVAETRTRSPSSGDPAMSTLTFLPNPRLWQPFEPPSLTTYLQTPCFSNPVFSNLHNTPMYLAMW